jgi:hypothetical protein
MLPWGRMLQAALKFGIGPRDFWALSLREWRLLMAASGHAGTGAMTREGLGGLIAAFPDAQGPHAQGKEETGHDNGRV